jgi:hypothetical protein
VFFTMQCVVLSKKFEERSHRSYATDMPGLIVVCTTAPVEAVKSPRVDRWRHGHTLTCFAAGVVSHQKSEHSMKIAARLCVHDCGF